MNTENKIRKIVYTALVAFVFVVAVVSCGKAQAQTPESPTASVEALPVTCTTPEEAEKLLGNTFDTMLLTGKSSVSGYGTAVLFNRSTGHYTIIMLTDDNRVCFVDLGKGTSKVLQRFI